MTGDSNPFRRIIKGFATHSTPSEERTRKSTTFSVSKDVRPPRTGLSDFYKVFIFCIGGDGRRMD
jgi:hypothetical protein